VGIGLRCQDAGPARSAYTRARARTCTAGKHDGARSGTWWRRSPSPSSGTATCARHGCAPHEGGDRVRGHHDRPGLARGPMDLRAGQGGPGRPRRPAGPDVEERFRICLEHARNAIAFERDARRAMIDFRKHLGWYTRGLPEGAACGPSSTRPLASRTSRRSWRRTSPERRPRLPPELPGRRSAPPRSGGPRTPVPVSSRGTAV